MNGESVRIAEPTESLTEDAVDEQSNKNGGVAPTMGKILVEQAEYKIKKLISSPTLTAEMKDELRAAVYEEYEAEDREIKRIHRVMKGRR
jgi:hypothetical protein